MTSKIGIRLTFFIVVCLLGTPLAWAKTYHPEDTSSFKRYPRSAFWQASPQNRVIAPRGWVAPKQGGFFKLGQAAIRADKFFAPDGAQVNIITTSVYITSLYGEFGITPKLTAQAYIPFFTRVTLNDVRFEPSGDVDPGDELNSFGDLELGFKYSLYQKGNLALSASLLFGIPTGNEAGGRTQLLQSGDGEFNQLFRLGLGYSVPNTKFYGGLSIGFNNRTQGFSEEFRYGAEVGYSFNQNYLLILKADGIESFKNGNAESTRNGIFSNNLEHFTLTPEFIYTYKNKGGITLNAGFPLRGNNVLAAPSYSVGIFWKPAGQSN